MSSNRRRIDHHNHHETSNRHNRNQTDELNAIKKALFTDPAGTGNTAGENLSALNTNLISSLTKLDTIATNTANIHIDVESVNLNVDTLEAKTEAISNGQTQNGDGTGNKPGVMLDAINTNTIAGNSKLDTIISNTAASTSTGLATEVTLSAIQAINGNIATSASQIDTDVTTIDTNNNLASAAVNGTAAVGQKGRVVLGFDGGNYRNLAVDSSGHLQVDIVSGGGGGGDATEATLSAAEVHLGNIETAVQLLDNIVSGSEAQVDIVSSALPTGAATETTLSAAEAHLGNIETAVQLLDNIVSGSEAQVDIVSSALPTGAATESTLSAAEAHLGNIDTGIDVLEACVGSNKVNVNISSGNITGFATESTLADAEAHLGNIETAVQLLDNIVSGSEAQVDIVSSALPTGAATETTLSAAEAHLGNIDTGIDVLEACVGSNKVNVNISSGNITGFATESTLADAETHLGNIETAVQLIDDVVGTDGSTGPAKCISIGATESGGNIQELLCDGNGRLSIDVNSAPTTAVTNSGLTELAAAINSNRVDVNIANGGFDGAVTNAGTFAVQVDGDALTSLQLIDDVVKAEDAAHSGGDKGIMALSVRKDTATSLAGSDADYTPLITDANGRLHVINVTAKSNGSETSYITSQSISGSGTHTGAAIAIDPNVTAIYAEHNFSHTGIKYEILASIDGTNFFDTGIEFNAGGMNPATLTGISTIKGVSSSEGFTPHIKFKFSNSDSSVQSATLSFVLQSS